MRRRLESPKGSAKGITFGRTERPDEPVKKKGDHKEATIQNYLRIRQSEQADKEHRKTFEFGRPVFFSDAKGM